MKKILLVILSTLSSLTILYGQANEFNYPDVPDTSSYKSEAVGGINGTFGVSPTGGATFSIPIEVPLGVGGMQPNLSIVYNSQSGNGIAGWGCNISGLSVITRGPKNIYHDGMAKPLTYMTDDAFYLDGKRLIYYSSGTAGLEGTVFYPESDPFTKVIVHGTYNTSTANLWLEVQAPDGMKYYYGNTTSGRLSYTSGSSPRIYSWYLDYAEDPLGNTMSYTYSNTDNFMRPNTIIYGTNKNSSTGLSNTITFSYESRSDVTPFFLEGNIKGQMNYRLKTITTKTGSNTYRNYDLMYNNTNDGTATKYSRLTGVTVKNAVGEALIPITLNWIYLPSFSGSVSQPTVNGASSYPTANFEEQRFTSGDLNGDGLTDIVGIASVNTPFTNDTHAYIYYASLNSSGNVQFMTGENFSIGSSFNMGYWSQQKGGFSAVDFDGNGVNELFIPNLTNDGTRADFSFTYYGSISGRFVFTLKYSTEMPLNATGDFNKDGKGDVIYMEKGHYNNKYSGAIVGWDSGTTLYKATFELTLPTNPEKMFVSDFNGDGLDDMMIFYSGGYTIFWNQGSGISTSTFTDSKKTTGSNFGAGYWTMIRSGDFNGDGLMDYITNDTNDTNWYFALNNGDGTFSRSVACSIYAYDQSSTSSDDDKFECMVFDFDSDGKDDVLITKAMYSLLSKTYTYWMRSDGTTLTQVKSATSSKTDDGLSYRYLTGDFNGDGQVELMNYGYDCYNSTNANSDPVWRLYRNSNFSADAGKVGTITDSYGGRTTISYASFANGGIYTKGTGSVYPVADYMVPFHAVKSVSVSNGTAGDVTTNYQYSGLKVHLQGKGILGLTSQKVDNITHGIVTESGVRTWNTSFYIPSETYSKTTVGDKTAETNATLTVVDKGSKKYFAYPSTKTDKDLDGNTVTTTFIFNTIYGYQEEEKADFGNNMYKTVQYGSYILAGGSYKPQLITSTQKHTDDDAAFTQKTAITYNTTKGYRTNVIENQGAALQLTADYTYDNTGNMLTSKESGSGITSVTVNNIYDATYRFLTKTYTTPASSVSSYTYDTWGNVLTEKDETLSTNVLTTTHTYNNWGNRTSTVFPDGTKITNQWGWDIFQSKCYYALTQGTGQPWVKTWYDDKGREVLVESYGEKNMSIKKTTSYNPKGQVSQVQSQTGNLTTTESYTYDTQGRIASSSNSTGQNASYTYGNRKVTTVANGSTYTKTSDAWGNIKTVIDQGTTAAYTPASSLAYTYYSSGKPKNIVADGATFSMTYDIVGNKATLTDPDAGTISYTYDAAGRLTKQVEGKGKVTTNAYNALGHLITTTIDGVATTYTYGTSGNELLQLTKVQTGNNYIAYTHDSYGRILTEKRQVEGNSGTLDYTYVYNAQGQLGATTYPDGLQVNKQYDAYGNLVKVLAGTQVIWELTGTTGLVTTTQLGGTLTATRTRNAQGLLTNLRTVYDTYRGTFVLRDMNYVFDGATGNLTSRSGMLPAAETFVYDKMDRLTSVKQGAVSSMKMTYLANGNISSKTGLGIYGYGTKPHAVTSVENTGNLSSSETQAITYTAFNKAASISEKVGADNLLLNFTYGPDQQRWKTELKKNNVLQKTIVFAGDYEAVTENGVTMQMYYISGGDGLAAVYVKQPGQTDKIYYVHTDHLGSIIKITDGNGSGIFNASYDAWGNRTVGSTFVFHRGYTGHEHLKEFGLIDMNGRMYDPVLGRFLSPDPYVQFPEFSQNYNRYSYCLNNPLKYTDPSGEWFGLDDLLIAGIGFVTGYVGYGIYTGDWGAKAFASGGMGALSGWLGYNTAGLASGHITGSTWNFAGSMAFSTAYNQLAPPMTIPINNHFGLSVSPGLGFGTSGLTGGMNIGASYTDGDFSIGAGIGVGNNHWGWNAAATVDGWGGGYGRTYYGVSEIEGQKYGAQKVGSITGYFNHHSFTFSNDALGDKEDRWRTNAVELNIGRYSIGTYLYTNWGKQDGEGKDLEREAPLLGKNKNGAWINGRVHFAPAWFGYRSKNGRQVTRIGFSHPMVQNLTQNLIHKYTWLGNAPYFLNYDDFRTGGYFYSGYNNPLSLWER